MASIQTLRQIWADVLGIKANQFGDNDNFMDLGGDSLKAIQFLGQIASYAPHIDLQDFLRGKITPHGQQINVFPRPGIGIADQNLPTDKAATVNSVWEIITGRQQNVDGKGHADDRNGEPPETTIGKATTDTVAGIGDHALASALERKGFAKEDILQIAPVSSVQEFYLQLRLRGDKGLVNYVYEVEGPNLKHGLRHLVRLLEAKNPIFRTVIIDVDDQKYVQVLLAKTTPSWFYPPKIQSYLQSAMDQEFQLGVPTVQYALIIGDVAHEMRNFFVISMYHTHCDAFSRFLIGKEILQILQSPSDYARAENIQRPWLGDFVRHNKDTAPEERFRQFWDNHLCGADVANIYPVEQAVISGALDATMTGTLPVPFHDSRANNDVSRSPTQVVLAAWAMALAKTSGAQDITFGLCRHGRSSHSFPDVWRVMGPLINGLPFRISVPRGEEPIVTFLGRIQDEITTTRKWEHGFAPCMFPSADGRPWVQSLVNLKPELQGLEYTSAVSEDESTITKMLPRPDFDKFVAKNHWAVLLAIKPQADVYHVIMRYQSPLVEQEKARALFNYFKSFMEILASTNNKMVRDLLV